MSADIEKVVKETANSLGDVTLPELVDRLVKEKGLKFNDASKTVYVLYKKGELEVSKPNPPSTFLGFSLSADSLWFWAITALVGVTLAVVFLVDTSPLIYVRYVLGGAFILFLPGAMLLAVLYPRGGEIDSLERLALSIGLSLAIVPLIGLILNYMPWGIRLTPIMIALTVFAEGLAIAALVRKFRYYKLSQK